MQEDERDQLFVDFERELGKALDPLAEYRERNILPKVEDIPYGSIFDDGIIMI